MLKKKEIVTSTAEIVLPSMPTVDFESFSMAMARLDSAMKTAIEGIITAFGRMDKVAREAIYNIGGHIAFGRVILNDAKQLRVMPLVCHPQIKNEPLIYGVGGLYSPDDLVVFYIMEDNPYKISAIQKAKVYNVSDARSFIDTFGERLIAEAGADFALSDFIREKVADEEQVETTEECGLWL